MRIYYTSADNGDGSASTYFFESQQCIDMLEEDDPERYGAGEGGSHFDVEGTHNIPVQTLKDVKQEIKDNNS